jgi:hypothetical protein
VSLCASLLAAEIGLRIWASAASHERALVFDPELGWRMLPEAHKLGGYWGDKWPARTNAHGFRDRERTFEKTLGITRIVAIGDSFTFGAEVDDGERFSDVLERLAPGLERLAPGLERGAPGLERLAPGLERGAPGIERGAPGIECLNLGVQAYGPDQELVLLEREGFRYAPDVVLWVVFLGNDLHDLRFARRFHWPRPYFTLDRGELTLHRAQPSWDVRLRLSSYVGEVIFRTFSGWIPSEKLAFELADVDVVDLFSATARRVARDCADHHARLLTVLLWPTKGGDFDVEGDGPRVRAALESIPVESWTRARCSRKTNRTARPCGIRAVTGRRSATSDWRRLCSRSCARWAGCDRERHSRSTPWRETERIADYLLPDFISPRAHRASCRSRLRCRPNSCSG